MSTFVTLVGLAAAACTMGANLPQLKKAWTGRWLAAENQCRQETRLLWMQAGLPVSELVLMPGAWFSEPTSPDLTRDRIGCSWGTIANGP